MSYSVEDTNMDSLASKVTAIDQGYFQDIYAQSICQDKIKKDVIIKRGYWARIEAIRMIIKQFSKKQQENQIISLGAGYDTTYFQLKQNLQNTKFIEIDLPEVVKKKVLLFKNSEIIMQILKKDQLIMNNDQIKTNNYNLIGCDIINIDDLDKKLKEINIDFSKKTLIFAECVLTYIDAQKIDNLIKYLSNNFKQIIFASYEMFNPNDNFGKMMVKNFQMKGCTLQGIHEYPNQKDQIQRYQNLNFQKIQFYDMLTFYNEVADQTERKRIEKIDFLDELEEWNLIMKHYFILVAQKTTEENSEDIFF